MFYFLNDFLQWFSASTIKVVYLCAHRPYYIPLIIIWFISNCISSYIFSLSIYLFLIFIKYFCNLFVAFGLLSIYLSVHLFKYLYTSICLSLYWYIWWSLLGYRVQLKPVKNWLEIFAYTFYSGVEKKLFFVPK